MFEFVFKPSNFSGISYMRIVVSRENVERRNVCDKLTKLPSSLFEQAKIQRAKIRSFFPVATV